MLVYKGFPMMKKIQSLIKLNALPAFKKKISNYFWWKYNRFLEKYIGRIPTPEAWQGQWLVYKKIEKKYLGTTYDINSIFPQTANVPDEKNIWVYWDSNIENAPDVVKKCFAHLQKNKPHNYRIISLSQENIKDYVNFPEFILDKLNKGLITQTHFSDILRTALVYQYGGIWVDSTCLLTQQIPQKVLNSTFFVFQANQLNLQETYPPIKCSNWFISSNIQKCRILERTLQILLTYWQKNNRILHYYLYHIIMAAVVNNDTECANIWNKMPYICNMNPHVLQYSFEKIYTEEQWENAIDSCFIHKLTYKYDKKIMQTPEENIFQHLMRSF